MNVDSRTHELPKSRRGPVREEPEKLVPLVLNNLKQIRVKQPTQREMAKFSAADIQDFSHDNELLELAESFVWTIEQVFEPLGRKISAKKNVY